VQLQTSQGNLNIEVSSDITPRTAWNFIALCKSGYYINTIFHRLIPGFMVQGGDPTGTGTGGSSAFPDGVAFNDEFDNRLRHSSRGILSMANSGKNTNKSQFFITFKECNHLDNKHTIFGRVVGGLATLQTIEELGTDGANRPYTEIKILKTEVFNDPMAECDEILRNKILTSKEKRKKAVIVTAVPLSKDKAVAATGSGGKSNDSAKSEAIAKFLQSQSQNNLINSKTN
jgi:peptidyl-prolyl cis-trans isomerase-like protein 2